MSVEKYEDLTAMHLDVLREVGNIGSGNASTALSGMIQKQVLIEMPVVKLVGFQEAIDQVGGAERIAAGVLSRMKGDVEGMILLLMEDEFVDMTLSSFFENKTRELLEINEAEQSALSEIGNIMGGAYASAIGSLTGMNIALEAPRFQVDMLGALMSVPVIEFGEVGDKLLFIDKQIKIENKSVKSNLMLIPTIQSLNAIISRLGVEI